MFTFRIAAALRFCAILCLLGDCAYGQIYNPANGHYYQRVDVPGGLDWFGAEMAASAMQLGSVSGHLVTLTSADENDFVFDNLNAGSAWLGGFQPAGSPEPAGGWQWVTGEPWTYANWHESEPNNYGGNEDGLQFLHEHNFWNDSPRPTVLNAFIVEYPTGGELFRWVNAAGGDFHASANWLANYVPTSHDPALFYLASDGYTVTASQDISTSRLSVGADNVTLDLGSHSWTLPQNNTHVMYIGEQAGDQGTLRISSGSVVSGRTVVGNEINSTGKLIVDGPTARFDVVNSALFAGGIGNSQGTIEIRNGGSASVRGEGETNLYIGPQPETEGTVVVSDVGTTLSVKGGIYVGERGRGIVRVEAGGRLDANGLSQVGPSGIGVLAIDGGSVEIQSQFQIGGASNGTDVYGGSGNVTIQNGGRLLTLIESTTSLVSATIAAFSPQSHGEVLVTGAGSQWLQDGGFSLGSVGSGIMHIEDHGYVECKDSQVARTATATAEVRVTGPGSLWSIRDRLIVGGAYAQAGGSATVEVSEGGKITAGQLVHLWDQGEISLSGGGAIDIGTVGNESLVGAVNVGSGGTLSGSGLISGNVSVVGGTVSPGSSPGSLQIVGDLTLNAESTLQLEIGGTATNQFDQLIVGGNLSIAGIVQVTFIDDFVPQLGSQFDLLVVEGEMNLADAIISYDNAPLGMSFSERFENGMLTVTATSGIAGDFDNDGDVDGEDFLFWQRNPSAGDLSDWQNNYGTKPLANATSVPEPGCLVFVAMAVIAFLSLSREERAFPTRRELAKARNNKSHSDGRSRDVDMTRRGRSAHASFAMTCLTAAVLLTVAYWNAPVRAADIKWENTIGGAFSDGDNWQGGLVPSSPDAAVFDLLGETFGVNFAANVTNDRLWIRNGNVTFDLYEYTYNLSNSNTAYNLSNDLSIIVGDLNGDNAALTLTSGTLQGVQARIGNSSGSTGSVKISGADSLWKNSQSLIIGHSGNIGNSGTGTLLIEAGGNVMNAQAVVGYSPYSTGAVTVTGTNSHWLNSESLIIGSSGTGTLLIDAGGKVTNAESEIGAANSVVTVRGTSSLWQNNGSLSVGSSGTGSLLIKAAGKVTNTQGYIGFGSNSTGSVTVSGAGSFWQNSGNLVVGQHGTATLLIEAGGHVTNGHSGIGFNGGSSGNVTVTGIGSTWATAGNLTLGFIPTFGSSGAGLLTASDSGLVTVSNSLHLYGTGTIDLTGGGAVAVGNVASPVNGALHVGTGGTLSGRGTINGDVQVNGGTVTPGAPLGPLTVNGDYQQLVGSSLSLQLGGTTPGLYDRLTVNGAATLGGTLQVTLANGFAPGLGDSFNVLEWNNRIGEFSALLLPGLGIGKTWNASQLYEQGILTVEEDLDPRVPQPVARWTFEAGTTGNPPAGIGSTIGNLNAATGSGVASGFHSNSATAWSNPVGNGSNESWSANSWEIGDYYQFQVSTAGMEGIELRFDQLSSGTGPRDFQVQYSTDGTFFTDYASPYAVRSSSSLAWNSVTPNSADTFSFDLSLIAALNDQESVFFRLAMASITAANGGIVASGGTSRIDNVTVLGVPIEELIPGDFDGDGIVDGRDFLIWQRNPSTGGLADWQANFGRGAFGSPMIVPEPRSIALLLSLIAVCAGKWKRP